MFVLVFMSCRLFCSVMSSPLFLILPTICPPVDQDMKKSQGEGSYLPHWFLTLQTSYPVSWCVRWFECAINLSLTPEMPPKAADKADAKPATNSGEGSTTAMADTPSTETPRSTGVTYALWLCGLCGLHHCYLRRTEQAIVWGQTCGMFGLGWLRDLGTIPRYITEDGELQAKKTNVPAPFSLGRFCAQVVVAGIYALVVSAFEIPVAVLHVVQVLAASVGAYLVGNIGTQCTPWWGTAAGAGLGMAISKGMQWTSFGPVAICAAVFGQWMKAGRKGPSYLNSKDRSGCWRATIAAVAILGFWTVLLAGIMTLPIEVKDTSGGISTESVSLGTVSNAYSTLGLEYGAPWDQVRKAYRRKAMELHPDKHPGREAEVVDEFRKVTEAKETLEKFTDGGTHEPPQRITLAEVLRQFFNEAEKRREEARNESGQEQDYQRSSHEGPKRSRKSSRRRRS